MRSSYAVRPIITTDSDMMTEELVRNYSSGQLVKVSSKTAAIRACREAGYRVLTVGGLVELTTETRTNADGQEVDTRVWAVTVHPEA